MTNQLRPFRHRLALAVLRLYPRAWRRRYGEEQAALVGQATPTWRGLIDLARTTAGEWVNPAARPVPAGTLKRLGRALARGYLTAGVVAGAARLGVLLIVLIDFSVIRHQPIRSTGPGGLLGLTVFYLLRDVWWGITWTWFYFSYSLAFTSPVLIMLFVSGVWRTSPFGSRIVWTSAVTLFQLWLMVGVRSTDVHADVGVAVGAWVLAATLFPRCASPLVTPSFAGAGLESEKT